MRDQGRLVEWFDDKGYGFIQPNDASKKRVFLHIHDFSRKGPRPLVGCALDYQVILDEQGRYRAQDVVYLKAKQTRFEHTQIKRQNPNNLAKLSPMQMVLIIYFIALGVLDFAHLLPSFTFIFICLISILTYWLYVKDKQAAQLGKRRVPEQTLHLLSLLGGWAAAGVAQQKLRHKTQKQPFRHIYFGTIALNLLLLIWLCSPFNRLIH